MSNFEQQIKNALSTSTEDEPGIIEMAVSNFRGRHRFMTVLSMVIMIGVLAGMVWCAVAFFKTSEVREMILYATLFLYFGLAVAMLKLWFWLMMIRYSIARELKRMELQFNLKSGRQG